MALYRTRRNIPSGTGFILLFMILLLVLLVPVKTKTIEVTQEITVLGNKTKTVPVEVIHQVFENVTVLNTTNKTVKINHTIMYDDSMYSLKEDDLYYANQEYRITLSEPYSGCTNYSYDFKEGSRKVNSGRGEICFAGSSQKKLLLKEIYVGEIDDYYFRLSLDSPEKEVGIEQNVTIQMPRNVTLINYTNQTVPANITKEVKVNKTVRTWLFG